MSDEDTAYFRARAEAEREMAAAAATQEHVAAIHEELARLYESLEAQPALRRKLRLAY